MCVGEDEEGEESNKYMNGRGEEREVEGEEIVYKCRVKGEQEEKRGGKGKGRERQEEHRGEWEGRGGNRSVCVRGEKGKKGQKENGDKEV